MFQIRGAGLRAAEVDCSLTPNDPVCVEIYGAPQSSGITYKTSSIQTALPTVSPGLPSPQPTLPSPSPGKIVYAAYPVATSSAMPWPLKWLLIGGAVYLGYKGYQRYIKKA